LICRHAVLILFIFFASFAAHAGFGDSVSIEGEVGLPSLSIENPDGSKAGYEGVSLLGRIHFPTYNSGNILMGIHGTYKRMYLENTYTGYDATEMAEHSGVGAGMSVLFGKLMLGVDYLMMSAQHHYTGGIGINSTFDYNAINAFAIISFRVGGLKGWVGYSYTDASIDSGQTGLSKDAALKEQQFFLNFIFNTDANVGSLKGILR